MWQLVLIDPYGDRQWSRPGTLPQLRGSLVELYNVLTKIDRDGTIGACMVRALLDAEKEEQT